MRSHVGDNGGGAATFFKKREVEIRTAAQLVGKEKRTIIQTRQQLEKAKAS